MGNKSKQDPTRSLKRQLDYHIRKSNFYKGAFDEIASKKPEFDQIELLQSEIKRLDKLRDAAERAMMGSEIPCYFCLNEGTNGDCGNCMNGKIEDHFIFNAERFIEDEPTIGS